MADDIVQIIENARVDATSLSEFMYYPASVTVNRRLAPPIHTLNYYLLYLEGLEKVYSQPTGTVEVNGEVVKTVRQSINDAIDSAILGDYQTTLESELVQEVTRATNRENDIEDALEYEVIRASDVENSISQDLSDLVLEVSTQKLDTGVTATAKFGGIARTQADKNAERLTLEDFGAIGDGTLHRLSSKFSTIAEAQAQYPFISSLDQSIDWAATVAALRTKQPIRAAAKKYVLTDGFEILDGESLAGAGVDYWDSYRPNPDDLVKSDATGTHFYMVGTGVKSHSIDNLANVLPAKTVNGVEYKFTQFTLEDSVNGAPATPRPFSCAVKVNKNGTLKNCRVIPNYNGLQGYIDGVGLSDDWDVGVWALGANDADIDTVQAVGHWRMAGFLLTENGGSLDIRRNPERIKLRNCWGTGVRGFVARNVPQYKVTAIATNTVTVDWMPSFCLTRASSFRTASGGTHTFTGYAFDDSAKTVTLTGVNPVVPTGTVALRGHNIGNNLSNTTLENCIFSSIDHVSGAASETLGLPISGAAEYDGYPLRNIVHVNTVFQTTYDKLNTLFGGAYDFKFLGCKHENGEMIAYSNLNHPHFTMNMRFVGEDGINDASRLGGFNPRSACIDSYQIPQIFTDGKYTQRPMPNKQLELQNQAGQIMLFTNEADGGLTLQNGDKNSKIELSPDGVSRLRGDTWRFIDAGGNEYGRANYQNWEFKGSVIATGAVRASVDNAHDLGSSSHRWRTVYAATGTISTSDERLKTKFDSVNAAEKRAALKIKQSIGRYQFTDAVDNKGNKARYHFGVGAQTVGKILQDEGLDPEQYAFYCYDEWDAQDSIVDADGNIESEMVEAGNRYGIRYDELAMFILAAI